MERVSGARLVEQVVGPGGRPAFPVAAVEQLHGTLHVGGGDGPAIGPGSALRQGKLAAQRNDLRPAQRQGRTVATASWLRTELDQALEKQLHRLPLRVGPG